MSFFLMSQGSFDPKIRFIGQKVCSVARVQTDRQTDTHTDTQTRKWIQRTPFQDFRIYSFNLSSRIGPIIIIIMSCLESLTHHTFPIWSLSNFPITHLATCTHASYCRSVGQACRRVDDQMFVVFFWGPRRFLLVNLFKSCSTKSTLKHK